MILNIWFSKKTREPQASFIEKDCITPFTIKAFDVTEFLPFQNEYRDLLIFNSSWILIMKIVNPLFFQKQDFMFHNYWPLHFLSYSKHLMKSLRADLKMRKRQSTVHIYIWNNFENLLPRILSYRLGFQTFKCKGKYRSERSNGR